MLTFALLRNSSDLHIYKDLYGERNKPEKNEKLPLNYNKNRSPEFQRHFLCVLCDFLTDLERFSIVKKSHSTQRKRPWNSGKRFLL